MSSTLNHPGQEGVGLYRGDGNPGVGPETIRDNLRPGLQPNPSEGAPGPPANGTIEGWPEHLALIERVAERMALTTRPDMVAATAIGNTDSSGNATGTAASPAIAIYRVAAGMEARMVRLTVNALVSATGVSYTPAVPFAADAAYIELFEVDSALEMGDSGLIDYAPKVSKAQLFPISFDFNNAAFCRGPKEFALRVAAGPASSMILCRYQIELRRVKGIA